MANQLASFDPVGSFQRGQSNQLAIQRQQQEIDAQPQRNELSRLKVATQGEVLGQTQREGQQSQQAQALRFVIQSNQAALQLPPEQRPAAFQSMLPLAQQAGINATPESLQGKTFDDAELNNAIQQANAVLQSLEGGGTGGTTGQRDRASLLRDLASNDPTVSKSASIALGLSPRAVGSAIQTITDRGVVEDVAGTEATIAEQIAGAKITGTAKAKAKSAPLIAKTESFIKSQVKLAESAAAERGEVLTDVARAEAALPGLTEVVEQLRSLAPIATSTFGGRVWDTAVKELGFGSTKGATASAKFGAMVNNQVLPLLKPTFGAAFTVQEGESLRATMGDVNASVEEKMATLDAFLDQKTRDIETKQRQLDGGETDSAGDQGVVMVDAQGNRARVFEDGRIEEL